MPRVERRLSFPQGEYFENQTSLHTHLSGPFRVKTHVSLLRQRYGAARTIEKSIAFSNIPFVSLTISQG